MTTGLPPDDRVAEADVPPTWPESLAARLPSFITDLFADRRALLALLASCVALAAAGLDPHVLDPASRRVQSALVESALRRDTSTELLVTIAALVQAGFVLLGGAVADVWRSERLLRVALLGLAIASVGAVLIPEGPGLVAVRVLAWACDGLIIPFAVATVATVYQREARATALGILFAVYGGTTALAPALVTAFGADGPEIQAFALCGVVALVAIWATRCWLPDLPGALREQHLLIWTTALWAFGVVVAGVGLVEANGSLVLLGLLLVGVALAARRIAGRPADEGVHARAAGAALVAGVVVGFAQAVPMLSVPAFFTAVQGIDGFVATLFVAPFAIALFAAGPVSGWLMARYSPRALIIGGIWAVAIADVVFFVVMSPEAPYHLFVVPFALVGAGFVVSTAVRTAVIFASTPRRMPGTAAALNEASIGLGSRVGVTLVVLLRSGALAPGTELDWLRLSLAVAAVMGILGGIAVFLLLGAADPVHSVWDLRDERAPGGA